MRHIIYADSEQYRVAILIKATAFNKSEIFKNYVQPLEQFNITQQDIIAFTLKYNELGKATNKYIKEYLVTLLDTLNSLGVTHLYVADTGYFKVLAGQVKTEPHFGYVLPCKIKGYEHLYITLGLNHQSMIYNPQLQAKQNLSLYAIGTHINGNYTVLGNDVIHSAYYPETLQEIAEALESLHQYDSIACDIEAFSLRFNEAGIATISFAWDQHNGIAFSCDYSRPVGQSNQAVKILLRRFFESYKGTITWHNAAYDLKVIIYNLWMKHLTDTEGLLYGLEVMTKRYHDTKVIAYLATNSTAGNTLGLKALAHEFSGNWAIEEIKDVRKITLEKLLQYNLVDSLSTNYVLNKYYPIVQRDNQEDLYYSLMLPSQTLLIQIELTGLPLNRLKVQEVKQKLELITSEHLHVIKSNKLIQQLNTQLQLDKMVADNAKLKVKQHPIEKYKDLVFNPNSGLQLQKLLYGLMGLPVIDFTDTKQPATGADTIEKLINHTKSEEIKSILNALIGYGKATKILSTFIPAFERAIDKNTEDTVWLHGSFNLGGTVSGRLSSSDPNLQNLPSGSEYGELIKECFVAHKGWLFCGADFNSLEDYISALTTKDKNKLAVYERHFDGHCLRAAHYFKDQLPHIDLEDFNSVNSIKKDFPDLRQKSKSPTFALTYQGTWHTLVNNLGFPEEEAKTIEANYHELYKESDEYIQAKLEQATHDGYVTVAFGLRVRTPLLAQVIFGSRGMPYEASAEGRTAGNALGQSYGLLNNRAAVEFMRKVWASEHRYNVLPVALIHDAIYILVKDNIETVTWVNQELIKSMQWQDLPELEHPTVKLGANLDIYWPSWANPITLPNCADSKSIYELCQSVKTKLNEQGE